MKKRFILYIFILLSALKCFATGTLKVTDDKVRIRNLPSIQYSEVLGIANTGDQFQYWCRTNKKEEVAGKSGYWYCIIYKEKSSWIFGAYVELSGEQESEVADVEKSQFYYNHLCEVITQKAEKLHKENSSAEGFQISTYGPHIVWAKVTANVKNAFNIKIGMSKIQIENIIGKDTCGFFNSACLTLKYDEFDRLIYFDITYELGL